MSTYNYKYIHVYVYIYIYIYICIPGGQEADGQRPDVQGGEDKQYNTINKTPKDTRHKKYI